MVVLLWVPHLADKLSIDNLFVDFGSPRIDFFPWELSAFTWFGSLWHFDLDFFGLGEVEAGDSESP
jgi:hypothetical protein